MAAKIPAMIAYLLLIGFFAVLAIGVPSPDLILVIIFTACLAGYDLWQILFVKR